MTPPDNQGLVVSPGGLVSLWMINVNMHMLFWAQRALAVQHRFYQQPKMTPPSAPLANGLLGFSETFDADGVSADECNNDIGLIEFIRGECARFELQAACDRLDRILDKLKMPKLIIRSEFAFDFKTALETIEDGLKQKLFYYYPDEMSRLLRSVEDGWKDVFVKFPSVETDARSAVDCYAMGHPTASIFHSMRVAEIGLRVLAKERRVTIHKKPLDWAEWQKVITGIRTKVERLSGKPRGPKRAAALEFYNGALGEFEAFKDVYRNNVMHVREIYDAPRALSALNHVREFMGRLATRIGEDAKKQITWGLPR